MSTDLHDQPTDVHLRPVDIHRHEMDPRPVRSSLANDSGVSLFRPVQPNLGLPRLLRKLVGINEDILDWVPEERPRYTRLGAIVLNTGVLAAVSMVAALGSVVDGVYWWLLAPIALLWGVIIITIDSWLICSTHGARRSTLLMYIPRLLLSALLGFVIAEPLVLWVFGPSISNEVQEHRKEEIDAYESLLRTCNPVNGQSPGGVDCSDAKLNIGADPRAAENELTQAIKNRDDLREQVNKIDTKWAKLEELARAECAGISGPGLTGVAGEGGECRRNRAMADQYRADNKIDERHADLAAAEDTVERLTADVSTQRTRTAQQISEQIAVEVEEKRTNLTDRGLLDDFDALSRLSDDNLVILVAHWALALLLVALDCLPVFSKMMSGTTAYDHRVRSQVEVAKRLHEQHLATNERRDAADLEIQIYRIDQKARERKEAMDGADRRAKELRRIELSDQIDRLAAALARDSTR